MAKSRLYLDSTILITFVFGSKLEPDKFDCVSRLFNYENIDLVTSLYALIELYNYPIFNFEMDEQEKRLLAKSVIISALLTETEIVPMPPRAIRSYYNNTFKMSDKSDIPHAILAYIEGCDYIVTYDRHFRDIGDKIRCITPEGVLGW